jgi:hypothetical protein
LPCQRDCSTLAMPLPIALPTGALLKTQVPAPING